MKSLLPDPNVVHMLPHARLELHPKNMRRIYPINQVQAMAESIAERGVIQPLIGVPGDDGQIWICAGNLRLAGIRQLGDRAPLVPVIIRERSQADQFLDMAAENLVRFDVDPVSEGLHFKRLLEQPKMNAHRLYKMTGIAPTTIANRLAWAELETEIQNFGAAGRLPIGAADLLIKIPAGHGRITLARRFVTNRTTIRGIGRAVNSHLIELGIQDAYQGDDPDGRAVALAKHLPEPPQRIDGRAHTARSSTSPLRHAAAEACTLCPLRDDLGVDEPAWSILSHGAAQACDNCGLGHLRDICNNCPLVTTLRHAYRDMVRQASDGRLPHKEF